MHTEKIVGEIQNESVPYIPDKSRNSLCVPGMGRSQKTFSLNDYRLVYSGGIADKIISHQHSEACNTDNYQVLEDLFVMFNVNRPDNFTGHSLSMSGVVALPEKMERSIITLTMKNGYINIKGAAITPDGNPADYVRHAPIDPEQGMGMIYHCISGMCDPDLKSLTDYLIHQNEHDFRKWAAAKSVHHNYLNGLLYHICRIIANIKTLSFVYALNYDLLMSAAIHNIGKLRELMMNSLGNAEYTTEGNLYGHLYLGSVMVREACSACGIDENSKTVQLLIHIILSHHGKMEYGTVKTPTTREAYVLHILDDLDSKLWIYEDTIKNTEPGTFSQPNRWLDGALVYNTDANLNIQ